MAMISILINVILIGIGYKHYARNRLIHQLYNADTSAEQGRVFREIHEHGEYSVHFYDQESCLIRPWKTGDYEQAAYLSITWPDTGHGAVRIPLRNKNNGLSLLLGE